MAVFRTSTASCRRRLPSGPQPVKIMSDRMSECISNRMSGYTSDTMPESMSERMSEFMSDRMSKVMTDRMSHVMSDRMPRSNVRICHGGDPSKGTIFVNKCFFLGSNLKISQRPCPVVFKTTIQGAPPNGTAQVERVARNYGVQTLVSAMGCSG